MILAIGISLIAAGFRDSQVILISFTIPVALGGLAAGRRGLLLAVGLSVGFVIVTALLETFAPALVGFLRLPNRSPLAITATFILLIAILSLFLDRFGSSLRLALIAAQAREQELDRLRASLEATVAERTASLQQALEDVEQREGRLAQTLADLRASELAVRELSAPVIPVLPGVLVAPLIGALDGERADVLTNNVLGMVEREGGRQVIFDITGVPVVDTRVARVLLQTASAVRLLGAQTSLVGMRPEVAQTIISLGVDFSDIATYPDLREAVEAILNRRDRSGADGVRRAV
jgi:anti-anti-sigma factor